MLNRVGKWLCHFFKKVAQKIFGPVKSTKGIASVAEGLKLADSHRIHRSPAYPIREAADSNNSPSDHSFGNSFRDVDFTEGLQCPALPKRCGYYFMNYLFKST